MSKPNFPDAYTALQRQVINRLAEIEESDRNACANCGGEDCICCEIWHDRQRWVSPEELFADDDNWDWPDEEEMSDLKDDCPCDHPPFKCPFSDDPSGMYFCRDHCGLGVDE